MMLLACHYRSVRVLPLALLPRKLPSDVKAEEEVEDECRYIVR
mgnify:CR=1 FL=1